MADNRSILRLLILLVAVTTGLTVYASYRFDQTLPEPLVAFIHARDNATAEVSSSEAFAGIAAMLLMIMTVTGLVGMWWCRRWARWIFTVAALAQPLLTAFLGWSSPATLISNAIESGANTASDMAIGATLALAWLVMEADFAGTPGHQPTA
jgi:hypothetical protein